MSGILQRLTQNVWKPTDAPAFTSQRLEETKVYIGGRAFEMVGDEPVDLRPRLEHFQTIDREHGIELASNAGGVDRAFQHVGRAIGEDAGLIPVLLERA